MKRIVLLVLIVVSYQAGAQVALHHGSFAYSKTVKMEGTKSELYAKAQGWVNNNFDAQKDEIRFTEGNHNFIEIHGTWYHELDGKPNAINYTYTIEILGGIYRETLKELSYHAKGRDIPYESKKVPSKKQVLLDTNVQMISLSKDFKAFIETEMFADNNGNNSDVVNP
jgi:hypothetical protein